MRSRSTRRKTRKRVVRKRFFIFLLVLVSGFCLVYFKDNISSVLAQLGDIKGSVQNTEDPVENTTPPASTPDVIPSPTPVNTPEPTPSDTEPPVIEGEDSVTIFIGEPASYRKYVTVTDNEDENVKLEIDSSAVNLNKEGTYTVIYTATDKAGNTSRKEVEIIVREKTEQDIQEEEVIAKARQVLSEITNDSMTPRETARAIYNWVRANIRYDGNYQNNTDWIKGAYDGFRNRRGDCYVFFGVTKALLNEAGIQNMDIVKKGGGHFWHLVNLGEGWYHYDTTPRRTGGEFFMMTDDEITEYSNKYGNSHVWERDKYPATPKD
ncbi:MAG: DUF5011 domain-containing protein [Clostridiales bacterium]|nr:DUF5011 domain-containing protein [Clostridiales bacterium]